MSKLSFRARALDAFKQMPIYICEDLPDLPEYSAINRGVPQMPSGMDKEEECEHHFQRAIVTGLIIPTPEVTKAPDYDVFSKIITTPYKPPKQLIRMQPFAMEEDYPDYDMDSEDEKWLSKQKLDITPLKFEEMMDRLEKNCAQNFASQDRKELLLKDDDELSIAIYDYWLSKRLKTPTALVPTVRTESSRFGGAAAQGGNNNPYLAFRRRTEKMQTRKNRKNDEASYEKMIKLKRDLQRVLQLLDLVKKREAMKKEFLQLSVQVYEKRYEANDLSGALLAEVSAMKPTRPAFAPLYSNQYHHHHHHQSGSHHHGSSMISSSASALSQQNSNHLHHHSTSHHHTWQNHQSSHHHLHLKPIKEDIGLGRREKRPYKKRKHKGAGVLGPGGDTVSIGCSSGDEETPLLTSEVPSAAQPTTAFPFLRNRHVQYVPAKAGGKVGDWWWASKEEGGRAVDRFRYSLASVTSMNSSNKPLDGERINRQCVGMVRRRVGRGGRVILDRAGPSMDDFWSSVDYKILEGGGSGLTPAATVVSTVSPPPVRYYTPKSPSKSSSESDSNDGMDSWAGTLSLHVETPFDCETVDVNISLSPPPLQPPPPPPSNSISSSPPPVGSSSFSVTSPLRTNRTFRANIVSNGVVGCVVGSGNCGVSVSGEESGTSVSGASCSSSVVAVSPLAVIPTPAAAAVTTSSLSHSLHHHQSQQPSAQMPPLLLQQQQPSASVTVATTTSSNGPIATYHHFPTSHDYLRWSAGSTDTSNVVLVKSESCIGTSASVQHQQLQLNSKLTGRAASTVTVLPSLSGQTPMIFTNSSCCTGTSIVTESNSGSNLTPVSGSSGSAQIALVQQLHDSDQTRRVMNQTTVAATTTTSSSSSTSSSTSSIVNSHLMEVT